MSASIPSLPFLFPRTITIRRQQDDDSPGEQVYSGLLESKEDVIASNIPARIQSDRQGGTPEAKLPADAAGQSIWKIIFKADRGLVRTRDIIVDDLGQRYQVISPYWGPLVTTCRVQILET
ncbi:hypothetical protein TA3x_000462 [Tundrisphaera sp. TA3]|uniref:hypothetical protein n=1 Tax=Tundrisphaera sp. TA3 TaxID=3435775 RepID=UPI003EBF44AC